MAGRRTLKWEVVGLRGMKAEPYRIAKVTSEGQTKYILHHDWMRLGIYDTFEQAKQEAQDHAEVKRD
jgi:hypothetical protein